MLIPEWLNSSDIDTDRIFLLRTARINHGARIGRHGLHETETQYMRRRSAVIEVIGSDIWLVIGSTSYIDGFESTDQYETLNKYAQGQFVDLIKVKFNGTIEEAIAWDARYDALKSMNTTPKVK